MCFNKNLRVCQHALASSFLLLSVHVCGLHNLKYFSVRHKLQHLVVFEYGVARATIFHVSLYVDFLSCRAQICLLNSVAFLLVSVLNEAV